MVDIDIYEMALKASWVRREITGDHDWCKLFRWEVIKGRFVWERNALSLMQIARTTQNKFWSEVITAMARYDESMTTDINDIGRHSIWFSNHTKFKTTEIRSWRQKGIVYINDLVGDNGEILLFEEAKSNYEFQGTVLDYVALVQSLPTEWKNRQRKAREASPIIHPNIQNIISQKHGNKYMYDTLLRSKYRNAINLWESGWEQELGQIDWEGVYKTNKTLISVTYQVLQYKILTKIIPTNRLLYHMGRAETFECDRCTRVDTVEHRFWSCPSVKLFWAEVGLYFQTVGIVQNISVFDKKVVILGCKESLIVNHIVILGKKMIAMKYRLLIEILLNMLKRDKEKEMYIAIKKGKMHDYDSKWAKLAAALD